MTLRLFYHPFSSYCQKVLIALYERKVVFDRQIIDLGDPDQRATLQALWPLAKFPVLRDEGRGITVPESSIIIEYLDQRHPGPSPMIPIDREAALSVRLRDRFFDDYVSTPMQKVVADNFRPEGGRDPHGVEDARALLARAYEIIDRRFLESGRWIAGDSFTLADCAAAPALFYANIARPFDGYRQLQAYYERLLERPSFTQAVEEARPYRALFPLEWPQAYR
jgi:glutathione S-transferase